MFITHPASRASLTFTCYILSYLRRPLHKSTGSCSSCSEEKSPMVVSLIPNNTITIERMTCHCFLQPIRRDLKSSSHITLNRVRSSMYCLLPGYSFEPRPNSPVLGIATSAGKTSLAIKNNIDLSRSANVSNFKASTWFRQSLGFFSPHSKRKTEALLAGRC